MKRFKTFLRGFHNIFLSLKRWQSSEPEPKLSAGDSSDRKSYENPRGTLLSSGTLPVLGVECPESLDEAVRELRYLSSSRLLTKRECAEKLEAFCFHPLSP